MSPMEEFIRAYSASIGLNPDVIMQTVLNEGGRSSLDPAGYARQSGLAFHGGQEQSYGPFQLFMGGGVGNRALKAGIDPRDPSQAYEAAKFAMDVIKNEGLGQWHGWKGGPWAAHGARATGANVPVPEAAQMAYDPRSDTPSSGRSVGSELPGQPAPAGSPYKLGHPPNPQVGTGGYVAPGAPTTPVPGKEPKSWGRKIADALAGADLGSFGGGGGAVQPLPASPGAANVVAQAKPLLDPAALDRRQQLAMLAMQRLNQGQLF